MRYTRAFIPTAREVPKDTTMPSHQLLLRAGYVRMVGAGIYEMLPLGLRVLHKVSDIVRAEMDAAGAQEVLMPALLPADYFKETDRWDGFGDTLFRLQDRRGQPYHLGPTHEEIFTDLVRREVKSYRQLPLNLYQIQAKYRDEPRPRGGLLRGREFLMKDAYSFDASEEGALASYESMRDAYHRIFSRLGLTYRVVRADSGAMGGSTSAEFQVLTQTGEDALVACAACEYAANAEIAEARAPGSSDAPDPATLEPVGTVATPNVKTIDEVVEFIGGDLTAARTLKSLVYALDDEVVLVVVRGDRAVNETRLARHLGVPAVVLASDATVEGRVRRTTYPDGRLKHVHTIKRGLGLVREETERELSPEEFAELWPRTEGRRILKTRHKVPAGELTWEVDAFLDRNLVLAEVELSSPTQAVEPPPWLAPYVLREVTNDPRYRNYALATGGTPR